MGPRSKNVKNVAKTTLKGVKKLFGGGSSSGDAVGRKRHRADGLTASARRGDHLEKEVLEVPEVDSFSEDSVDSVDSDTNVGLDVGLDKGKSIVEEESESEEESEEEDEQDDDVEEYVVEDVPPVEEAPPVLDFVRKSNDDLEFQRGVYGGGPYESELLYDYAVHVARDVWERREDRGALKCVSHLAKLSQWNFKNECERSPRFVMQLRRTGLFDLVEGYHKHMDPPLISAFVERWHPETNTFHMLVGEMTMTLDDVVQICGVTVRGRAVQGDSELNLQQSINLLHLGLGLPIDLIRAEMEASRFTSKVRLEFIRKHFANKVHDSPICDAAGNVVEKASSFQDVQRTVRAFILFFFGCAVFTDKSWTGVPICYLRPLLKFSEIEEYAWGAAILAFLYRGLGAATCAKVKGVTGYMTLLQAWIYEYFSVFMTVPNFNYISSQPRAHRHIPVAPHYYDITYALQFYRAIIDDLNEFNVVWHPYKNIRDTNPIDDIAFFEGLLYFFNIVELYTVARVVHQLGHMQLVSVDPPTPNWRTRIVAGRGYEVNWTNIGPLYWESRQNHVIQPCNR